MLNVCRLAALVLGGFVLAGSLPGSLAHAQSDNGQLVRHLAGIWKAQEYKVRLSSDLDRSVWGPEAYRVRNVELAIEPEGNGVLKIFTSVVDGRGKAKPYSSSVVQAQLTLAAPEESTPARIEPRVTVVNAEERFLDGSGDKWPVTGLTVKLHTQDLASLRMEMRYDTANGTGSFGDTLVKSGRSGTGRPSESRQESRKTS